MSVTCFSCKKISKKASIEIGNTGGIGTNGSGAICIAFSAANSDAFQRSDFSKVDMVPNDEIDLLLEAKVQSLEEARINARIAAETMEGINGNKSYPIPHELLVEVLKKNQIDE